MKPSFVNQPKPFLVSVITEKTPQDVTAVIRNSEYEGAQAFDLHLRCLDKQYVNEKDLSFMFHATCRPMMSLCYRGGDFWSAGAKDEELVETQMMALRAGAAALDIMADMYDVSPETGVTYQPEAVEKQKRLIDRIHKEGGEAVFTCHQYSFCPQEDVLERLVTLQERGADMVKIAHRVDNPEQLAAAMATTVALKRELKIPFIHICMGQYGKLHRFVSPMLGSALTFCVQQYTSYNHREQPLLRAAKAVFDNLDWRVDRNALPDDERD